METYRTASQVARMFRIGMPTVRRYIRRGELPAARVGRSYVVSGADIDSFVATRKAAREEKGGHAPANGRAARGSRPRRK